MLPRPGHAPLYNPDLEEGTPLQHLKQVDFDTGARPVMRSLEWHVPSVIELHVYRRGPGPV